MHKIVLLATVLPGISFSVVAQHEHHKMPAKRDTMNMDMK